MGRSTGRGGRPGGSNDALATLHRAVALHQNGRFAEATALYDRVLRLSPGNADALHLSGLVKAAQGDAGSAIGLIRQAIAGDGRQPTYHLNLGRLLAGAGRHAEAAAAFAEAARLDPGSADAAAALGDTLYDLGRMAEAADAYRAALRSNPGLRVTAFNLGAALRDAGRTREALDAMQALLAREPGHRPALEQALSLAHVLEEWAAALSTGRRLLAVSPDHVDGAKLLANAARALGRTDEARRLIGRVLRLRPDLPDAAVLLGTLRQQGHDLAAAVDDYRRALVLAPDSAAALSNLGLALGELNQPHGAVALHRAARVVPGDAETAANTGAAYRMLRDAAPAERWTRRALVLEPGSAQGWANAGLGRLHANAFEDAVPVLERALALRPRRPALEALVHSNLGVALMSVGRIAEAVAAFRAALNIAPGDAATRSNLLFCLCFAEAEDLGAVFDEHRAYERFVAAPRRPPPPLPAPPALRDPERRLRIGYVSPDFQRYPGPGFHFLLPLFEHHDRSAVELFAYYNDTVTDDATRQFQAFADHWRDVAGLSDEALDALIRADGIDLLVDCDGHMSRNRMRLFLGKPAPLQLAFPLYPNTSGLSAMDYRIADPRFVPADDRHTEKHIRLPGCVLCYRPAASAVTPPARPPVADTGVFTFGSFNNLAKLNEPTLALWARVLRAVPEARLMLKWRGLANSGVGQRVRDAFAAHGVPSERLVLRGPTPDPYEDYVRLDAALDPVFANGGTTTCDALWMGVPVLSLTGTADISRWGAALLGAVGLQELAVGRADDYVALAVRMVRDPGWLARLRTGLRDRVAASPLMDERGYARAVETGYRAAWRRWCAGLEPAPIAVDSPAPPDEPRACPLDLASARRILVVKLDEAGDFVLASPFLRGLRASAPQARIVLAVRPAVADLAAACPHVDAVIAPTMREDGGGIDIRAVTPGGREAFAEAFRAGFDLAVVPRYDFDKHGAATLARNSRARVIAGFSEGVTPWKAEANAGFDRAFTHTLAASSGTHEVEHGLALLGFLGGRPAGTAVEAYLTDAHRAAAVRLLGSDGPFLAVAPGAAGARREYPVDRLATVAARIAASLGLRVVVLGAEADRPAAAALGAALPVLDLTGRTSLPEAAAVLERAAAALAMDSAPAHLAAAVGTPVAVFSCHPAGGDPTHIHAPERFHPWSERALVLRPDAVEPCSRSCTAATAHCIAAIDPEAAARAVLSFLAAGAAR